MAHDLDTLLAEVLTHFERPMHVYISWADPHEVRVDSQECWAASWAHESGRFIVIANTCCNAPRYVVKYLIFHEYLHFEHPPRKTKAGYAKHHRAFRVAERIWSDYLRAEAWLAKHA